MFNNKKSHSPTHLRKVRYTYTPVQEVLETEDKQKYVSYGISVRAVDDEVAFISDVSTEFEEVRQLATLCTENELDPEQFPEVVEDFLNDESTITA